MSFLLQTVNVYSLLQEIYPGQFQPSPCHRFIAMLDKQEKLLRNYTQNIDTLEQVAGVDKIIQCHGELRVRFFYCGHLCSGDDLKNPVFFFLSGSFATASCLVCKHKVDCEAIREDIFNQVFIKTIIRLPV